MSPRFVRSKVTRATALISLAFVAACGSDDVGNAKLKALKTGDSKNRIAEMPQMFPENLSSLGERLGRTKEMKL